MFVETFLIFFLKKNLGSNAYNVLSITAEHISIRNYQSRTQIFNIFYGCRLLQWQWKIVKQVLSRSRKNSPPWSQLHIFTPGFCPEIKLIISTATSNEPSWWSLPRETHTDLIHFTIKLDHYAYVSTLEDIIRLVAFCWDTTATGLSKGQLYEKLTFTQLGDRVFRFAQGWLVFRRHSKLT